MTTNKTNNVAIGVALASVVSVLTILSLLGILPWETKAGATVAREALERRLERIEKVVDDIHKIFYPRRGD